MNVSIVARGIHYHMISRAARRPRTARHQPHPQAAIAVARGSRRQGIRGRPARQGRTATMASGFRCLRTLQRAPARLRQVEVVLPQTGDLGRGGRALARAVRVVVRLTALVNRSRRSRVEFAGKTLRGSRRARGGEYNQYQTNRKSPTGAAGTTALLGQDPASHGPISAQRTENGNSACVEPAK